jgi:roadblock/LC7 domain-containing protein
MARLAKMTPQEVFQTAVRAGIYTSDGKLTEHYADAPDRGSEK